MWSQVPRLLLNTSRSSFAAEDEDDEDADDDAVAAEDEDDEDAAVAEELARAAEGVVLVAGGLLRGTDEGMTGCVGWAGRCRLGGGSCGTG